MPTSALIWLKHAAFYKFTFLSLLTIKGTFGNNIDQMPGIDQGVHCLH